MRRNHGFPPFHPYAAWSRLALQYAEMLAASAVVIHHRTGRMAAAGTSPNARDRKEFTRMGQEKLDAAAESAQAMAQRMGSDNVDLGARMMQQMMHAGTGLLGMWMAPALFWSPQGQARARRAVFSGMAPLASLVSNAGVSVARHGLKPVHARATANARRLVYRPAARRKK